MHIRILCQAVLLCLLTPACASSPEIGSRPPVAIPPAPRPLPPRVLPPRAVPQAPIDATRAPPEAMVQGIKALWAGYPDRAGVAVIRDGGQWVLQHRGFEAMPQQSVSKLWVAITFLEAVDRGQFSLSDSVTVMPSDIVVFSNGMEALVGTTGYQTTYADLLSRQLTKSDNTANDFLLRKAGGSAAVRAMLASKGLDGIKFGPGENLLQAGTAGLPWREEYHTNRAFRTARAQLSPETRTAAMTRYLADPVDGASPVAIARALLKLKRGELLSPASTRTMLGLMSMTETGPKRLKAGVPYDWGFAHKTGTGQDHKGRVAGYNDVAILTAPDGTSYAVVVQIAETTRPIALRQQFMQGVSATVAANHR